MFALCHYKDDTLNFILYSKDDFKDVTEQMNIEIEKEITFEEFNKDYSFHPLMSLNDLILRSLNQKARTNTHVLNELNISCWQKLSDEYNKIQEKKSSLSRSQREMVVKTYEVITSC